MAGYTNQQLLDLLREKAPLIASHVVRLIETGHSLEAAAGFSAISLGMHEAGLAKQLGTGTGLTHRWYLAAATAVGVDSDIDPRTRNIRTLLATWERRIIPPPRSTQHREVSGKLTAAEWEVLRSMAAGDTREETLKRLSIIDSNLESRIISLYKKLGAKSYLEIVLRARALGLLHHQPSSLAIPNVTQMKIRDVVKYPSSRFGVGLIVEKGYFCLAFLDGEHILRKQRIDPVTARVWSVAAEKGFYIWDRSELAWEVPRTRNIGTEPPLADMTVKKALINIGLTFRRLRAPYALQLFKVADEGSYEATKYRFVSIDNFRMPGCTIDPGAMTITSLKTNATIKLKTSEYRLIAALARAGGSLGRDQVINYVYGPQRGAMKNPSHSLNSNVLRVRKILRNLGPYKLTNTSTELSIESERQPEPESTPTTASARPTQTTQPSLSDSKSTGQGPGSLAL